MSLGRVSHSFCNLPRKNCTFIHPIDSQPQLSLIKQNNRTKNSRKIRIDRRFSRLLSFHPISSIFLSFFMSCFSYPRFKKTSSIRDWYHQSNDNDDTQSKLIYFPQFLFPFRLLSSLIYNENYTRHALCGTWFVVRDRNEKKNCLKNCRINIQTHGPHKQLLRFISS